MGPLSSTIFILHGWTYSTDKWQPFVGLLKSQGYRVKLLPIPGLTQPLNQAWTLNDYVNWLKTILDKETKAITLLGHSNGGRIALAFAARYPEKLSQLILIDSAGIYHKEFLLQLKRFVFRLFAKIGKKLLTSSPSLERLLYRLAGETDYYQANAIMRQTMIDLSVDLTPILSRISVPTLIIWGSLDKTTPLSDGQIMHRLIKNSTLHTIAAARHSPQFTHPQLVVQSIRQFLDL